MDEQEPVPLKNLLLFPHMSPTDGSLPARIEHPHPFQ